MAWTALAEGGNAWCRPAAAGGGCDGYLGFYLGSDTMLKVKDRKKRDISYSIYVDTFI